MSDPVPEESSSEKTKEKQESKKQLIYVAVDAMGGDFGPEVVIPGIELLLKQQKLRSKVKMRFQLYGDEGRISDMLEHHPRVRKRSQIVHTAKMIRSDEKPSLALRNSKDTSMRLAIEAVRDGKADAVVSAGNTGALMAMAKMVLKTVPGIHRPAIASRMPTLHDETIMLDLGANVLVDAENLVQFAVLGSVFARAHKDIESPTVGLLNVGSEEMKGPDHVRSAGKLLSEINFHGEYVGFVEGNDINKGTVDVVVCDGYVGNIALKTMEGTGKMLSEFFKRSIKSDVLAMFGGILAFFALKRFKNKADPRLYNGGVFLGLNGICVKSHGGGDALAFSSAMSLAIELVKHGTIKEIAREIEDVNDQETILAQGDLQD